MYVSIAVMYVLPQNNVSVLLLQCIYMSQCCMFNIRVDSSVIFIFILNFAFLFKKNDGQILLTYILHEH